jgi:hypothetical protein
MLLFSCEEILLEQDISESNVELIAPANNSQFSTTTLSFSWQLVENATEYQLQIAKPNFTAPLQIVIDTLIQSNSFPTQLQIGQYEWRVRALNSGYSTPYSNRFFSILNNDDFQNNTVILTTPSNNLNSNIPAKTLSWQPLTGATNYQIQIIDSQSNSVVNQSLTNTTYNHTFSEGLFSWKVRASNGTENTLYTARSILIDTTVPNIPILNTPANNSSTAETNISFSWNRIPISGSVEIDHIYIYSNSALTNVVEEADATTPYSTTLTTGTYYWRVKSLDAAANESNFSNTFSFTIN